jgi:hypothetical protein
VNAESALYARLYTQTEEVEAPTFTRPVAVPRAPVRRRPLPSIEVPVFPAVGEAVISAAPSRDFPFPKQASGALS